MNRGAWGRIGRIVEQQADLLYGPGAWTQTRIAADAGIAVATLSGAMREDTLSSGSVVTALCDLFGINNPRLLLEEKRSGAA